MALVPVKSLAVGAAAVGGIYLVARAVSTRKVARASGRGGQAGTGASAQRFTSADLRSPWTGPALVEAVAPAPWGLVGCNGEWFRADPWMGRRSSSRTLRLPNPNWTGPGCRAPQAGRSWWQPIQRAYQGTNAVDSPRIGGDGLAGPSTVITVRAVSLGDELLTLAADNPNFRQLTVRGNDGNDGQLYIGPRTWAALNADGSDVVGPVLLYNGRPVPPAAWPGAVAPWREVAERAPGNLTVQSTLTGQGTRQGALVAPYDAWAPVMVWAVLNKSRVSRQTVGRG